MDDRGRILAEPRYDQAWDLREGHGKVQLGGLFGLVDSTGAETVKPACTGLGQVARGLVVATTAEGSGVIDLRGRVVLPMRFDAVTPAGEGLFRVERHGHMAYMRSSDGSFLWKEEGFGD